MKARELDSEEEKLQEIRNLNEEQGKKLDVKVREVLNSVEKMNREWAEQVKPVSKKRKSLSSDNSSSPPPLTLPIPKSSHKAIDVDENGHSNDISRTVQESSTRVFFDMTIGGVPDGRILMELFTNTTSKTAENFRALCTGEKGIGTMKLPLHYKGSKFHRVIKNYVCQGGDITHGTGMGGQSIYGVKYIGENCIMKPIRQGTLWMFKQGSQFSIYTAKIESRTSKTDFFAFGHVMEEMNVVHAIEAVGSTVSSGKTSKPAVIADCGQL